MNDHAIQWHIASIPRRALFWSLVGILCAITAMLPPQRVYAQNPTLRFENLTIEQGLSQNDVYGLVQDRAGFIWIGTGDGVNRYDGYTFTVYKSDPTDPHSLSNNGTTAMLEDSTGTLWVATRRGLNRFHPETTTFTQYLLDQRISSLFEDAAGTLWAGTWSGALERYDRATDTWTPLNVCAAGSGCLVYQDSTGAYWLTDKLGVHRFDPTRVTTTPFILDPANPKLQAFHILEDRTGTQWFSSDHGVYARSTTGTIRHFAHDPNDARSLSTNYAWLMHEDRNGTLWIETRGGGLDQFEPRTGTFIHHRADENNLHSLGSDHLFSFLEDRSGLLWIGTEGGGVSILNPATIPFHHYTADPTQPSSMRGRNISALMADRDGNLWVGTKGDGLNVFDRTAKTVKTYQSDVSNERALPDSIIYAVFEDERGTIWIGTAAGLARYHADTDTFTTFRQPTHTSGPHASDVVQQIVQADNGRLWIGTEGGLSLFDPASGQFIQTYFSDPNNAASIAGNDISGLFRDAHGLLWIGSWNGGLSTYDPATNRFTRFPYDPTNPQVLNDIYITNIMGDEQGRIWITTTGGVELLDPATGLFTHIREQNGLPSSNINCAVSDTRGSIWLTTSAGLAQLDTNAAVRTIYTASDGLQSNEFTNNCALTKTGEVVIGGVNGFNIFDPAALKRASVPPSIAITAFHTTSNSTHFFTATSSEVSLPYTENGFTFDFAALDYTDSTANRYTYKLEGFDTDWIEAGTRHTASYTNLDGGNYVFRVKAANSYGVWNEAGIAVPITLAAPPWRTWWAYSVYALACASAVVGFVHYRTGRQQQQIALQAHLAAQLETQVFERTAALSAANEALRASGEQFRAFFEQAPVGIVVADNGVIQAANPAWQHMFGYSAPASFQGHLLISHVAPSDRADVIERVMRASVGDANAPHYTFNALRADGARFPAFAQVVPAMPFDQSTAEVNFVVDMTALRSVEEERDQLFQLSHDLLCISGSDGYFKRLNPAWERVLGFTCDEMYSKPLIWFIHPDDRRATQLVGQYGIRGKRMVAFENRYRCKDGGYRWLSWSATLVPEGQLFYGVARDITDRKLAEREQQRLHAVTDSLRDVLAVINSDTPLPDVLGFIAAQATELLGVDAAQIYQFQAAIDNNAPYFRVEASHGFAGNYLDAKLDSIELTLSYQAVQTQRPQTLVDITALLANILAQPTISADHRRLIDEARGRFQAILALPLIIGGQVYGTLTLYNAEQRMFSEHDIMRATAFVTQSTLAIENAHLRERVERAAIAEERGRLARNLHDSVTQALYSLCLLAEACRFEANEHGENDTASNYGRLGEIGQQALKEMRLLIYQLRSPLVEQEGLIAALQQRLDMVERGSGIKTRLLPINDINLSPQVEEELFWIVQEALNNALKHANARHVTVRIGHEQADVLTVVVSDDGVGFVPDTAPRGVGISSMQERAAGISATIAVQSTLHHGTDVIVHVPHCHTE